MDPVEVDGSQGEGGGQILRTALTFSVIRKVPVKVTKIRAGRESPGLKRQHASALKVLASVFGGTMEGAVEGSNSVRFAPGKGATLESYRGDMGTAASITLVLQSVIPAASLSGTRLSLELTGGTDVPWSPTFDYFASVVVPAYRAIGVEAVVSAPRRGYYPRGGGRVAAEISPGGGVAPVELTKRPVVPPVVIQSRCGSLQRSVAERQARAAEGRLRSLGLSIGTTVVSEEPSSSPGTSLSVHVQERGVFLGSDSIGARGKRAEEVGFEAAESFGAAIGSGGCLDSHVADMVVPLLSLAPGPSVVMVQAMTPHLESGLRVAERFTPFRWSAEQDGPGTLLRVFPGA